MKRREKKGKGAEKKMYRSRKSIFKMHMQKKRKKEIAQFIIRHSPT